MSKCKTFLDVLHTLEAFWSKQNFCRLPSSDLPKGAATGNHIFLHLLLGENFETNLFTVDRVRRPKDAIPNSINRLFTHTQFEVVDFTTSNPIMLLLESLSSIFPVFKTHFDIKLYEDNWCQPTLGAYGKGWELRLNGMEVVQITYFQQICGKKFAIQPIEFAYGIERILLLLNPECSNIFECPYNNEILYGNIFKQIENEMSASKNFYTYTELEQEYTRNLQMTKEAKKQKNLSLFLEHLLLCSESLNRLENTGRLSKIEKQSRMKELENQSHFI